MIGVDSSARLLGYSIFSLMISYPFLPPSPLPLCYRSISHSILDHERKITAHPLAMAPNSDQATYYARVVQRTQECLDEINNM